MIYPLRSILDRVELADLFPRSGPIEVELGAGDGSFLVEYAVGNPEANFIGTERLLGRIRRMERKARRANLTNLRGVRIESSYFLEFLLPRQSARALHIYFPDPWPKHKHRRHRLINERFPQLAYEALAPEGTVYLRTDDESYFQQMMAVFGSSPLFRAAETPEVLSRIVTDFERAFIAQGIQTRRAAFSRS